MIVIIYKKVQTAKDNEGNLQNQDKDWYSILPFDVDWM